MYYKNADFYCETLLADVPFGYFFTFEPFFSAPESEIYQRRHYDAATDTIECMNIADRTDCLEVIPEQIVYLKSFGE